MLGGPSFSGRRGANSLCARRQRRQPTCQHDCLKACCAAHSTVGLIKCRPLAGGLYAGARSARSAPAENWKRRRECRFGSATLFFVCTASGRCWPVAAQAARCSSTACHTPHGGSLFYSHARTPTHLQGQYVSAGRSWPPRGTSLSQLAGRPGHRHRQWQGIVDL